MYYYRKSLSLFFLAAKGHESMFAWLLLSGGLLLASCRKPSPSRQPPLLSHSDADSRLYPLIDFLNKNPQLLAHYQALVAGNGQPQWEKAAFSANSHLLTCLLPLVDEEHNLSALLVVEWGVQLNFKLYLPKNYPLDHPDADGRRIARALQFLQYKLTGRLPRSSNEATYRIKERQNDPAASVARINGYIFTYCYDWVTCTGDGLGNCVSNILYHSECFTDIIWAQPSDYSYDGGAYPGYVDAATGGGAAPDGSVTYFEPPRQAINPTEYLRCFDPARPASLTIYADQPVAGYNEPVSITGGIGHAFISIEQQIGAAVIRRLVGFYPATRINPFNRTTASSQLGADGMHVFDVSVTRPLQPAQLQRVLAAITTSPAVYDIAKYNCVDFVIDVAAAGGIVLPRTVGWWIVGRGANPGDFGEDLRKLNGATTRSQKAPAETGSCP